MESATAQWTSPPTMNEARRQMKLKKYFWGQALNTNKYQLLLAAHRIQTIMIKSHGCVKSVYFFIICKTDSTFVTEIYFFANEHTKHT